MMIFTTQTERAAMVPPQVRTLLDLLTLRPGYAADARVAGGAVRDALLGLEPKDWDVATLLLPPVVMALAVKAGFDVIPTGLHHGTVTVVVDGMPLEVTTLRADVVTDGRHAEVEFVTDWKEDAARRDLTMNAMFMHADGSVDDFFGGMDDLAKGMVRFVGSASERMQEDYLRILRFFRFAGRMGVRHFDCEAMRAASRNSNGLSKISGERVWMELSKILTGNIVHEVLSRMSYSDVFGSLGFPNVNIDQATRANGMNARAETVLAALLDDFEAVEKAADAWKLSRKERRMALFVASHINSRVSIAQWNLMDWKKLIVTEGREPALELLSLTNRIGWKEDVLTNWEVPVFPLTGDDILNLGVAPGPEVGRRLQACKELWLDSEFKLDRRKLYQLASVV